MCPAGSSCDGTNVITPCAVGTFNDGLSITTSLDTFEDGSADGWSSSDGANAQATNSEVGWIFGGNGGYNNAGNSVTLTKTWPDAEGEIHVSMDYIFLNSWDSEQGIIHANGVEMWNSGGISHPSGDQRIQGVTFTVDVPAGTGLTLDVTSTLDQTSGDESFGIDNVVVTAPSAGCQVCEAGSYTDSEEGSTSCTICPAGSACDGTNVVVACEAGTFSGS